MIQIVEKSIDRSFLDKIIQQIESYGKKATIGSLEEKPELILSLGGDGTVLRAAEIAYKSGAPILAINLGRVGFLTSADFQDAKIALDNYFSNKFSLDKRRLLYANGPDFDCWALNEVALEKENSSKMLALSISIDGKMLSTYGADGIICSTATGSTAHAFSAGGPIMFPDVDAIEIIPIAAHALFSKPIILGKSSKIQIKVLSDSPSSANITFDGRRNFALKSDCALKIGLTDLFIDFVNFSENSFTSKIVDKFQLPVHEWRYIDHENSK